MNRHWHGQERAHILHPAVKTWKNIQAMEHYSASKRKAILSDAAACRRPEDTALSGTSPSGRLRVYYSSCRTLLP